MTLRQQIKSDARLALKNSLSKAVAITFTLIVVSVLFTFIEQLCITIFGISGFTDALGYINLQMQSGPASIPIMNLIVTGVCALFSVITLVPLNLGSTRWYVGLVNENNEEYHTIFNFFASFKLFIKSIWFYINYTIRSMFWMFLFLLPSIICLTTSAYLFMNYKEGLFSIITTILMLIGILLFIISMIFGTIYLQKYFLVPYLICTDQNYSVMKAFKTSCIYTKGRRKNIFMFYLSFFPWYLLCILIIPILYVAPYISTSAAIYAKFLISKGEQTYTVSAPDEEQMNQIDL